MDEQNDGLAQGPAMRDLKPIAQLSNGEIVSEARDLHAHFQQLSERYQQAPAT